MVMSPQPPAHLGVVHLDLMSTRHAQQLNQLGQWGVRVMITAGRPAHQGHGREPAWGPLWPGHPNRWPWCDGQEQQLITGMTAVRPATPPPSREPVLRMGQ